MFKKVLVFLLVMVIGTLSFACAGAGTTTEQVDSTGAEAGTTEVKQEGGKDKGKQVIKLAADSQRAEWYESVAEEYEKMNPDVDVQFVEIVAGSDLYTKITMMMQSPQTCPDVITEDGFMINSDAQAGYLEPLDTMIAGWEDAKNFAPAIMDGAKAADGKQYGIPISTDTQGIWYNKVMMKEAGIPVPFEPKTWDDILDAAKKLKAIGGKDFIPLFMYASKTSPEETSMRTFQVLYSGTGSELYDFDSQKWIVDKKSLKSVYDFIDTVYNKEKVGAPLSIVAQQNVGDLFQSDYMKNNKMGMYLTGSWTAGNWGEGKQYEWPEGLDNWGMAKIPTMNGEEPGYTTMSGGWTLAIPSNANNKEGAQDFLKFLTNKENQLSFALLTGDLAVRTDVTADESYLNQDMAVVKEAGEMLEYAHFRPSVEGYATITAMYTEIVESIAMAAATPDEAVATFESELKRIVGEDKVLVKE